MSQSSKSSPWVWLSLAGVVGLFTLFIFYLDQSIVKSAREPDRPQPQQPISGEPIIDFYQVLPTREVEVQVPKPVQPSTAGADAGAKPGDRHYLLQAGSFRKAQDADRRKAELALLGLEARISLAQVDGEPFHRVELGPFADDDFYSRVRSRLIKNRINYIAKSID